MTVAQRLLADGVGAVNAEPDWIPSADDDAGHGTAIGIDGKIQQVRQLCATLIIQDDVGLQAAFTRAEADQFTRPDAPSLERADIDYERKFRAVRVRLRLRQSGRIRNDMCLLEALRQTSGQGLHVAIEARRVLCRPEPTGRNRHDNRGDRL